MTNFPANRRMNNSQQMRWSRRGADLLLQVRYTVPNGKFDSGFTDFFKADLSFISAALFSYCGPGIKSSR